MGLEQERLTEEDIQRLVERLDNPLPTTTRGFVVEVMTSPYVTFSEETVMEIAEYLGKVDEILAPVALLDLTTGDLCACYVVEAIGAEDAIAKASAIFKEAAGRAGLLIEGLDRVFSYPAPPLPAVDEEEEEEGGE